jgi:WD40 repeat protein
MRNIKRVLIALSLLCFAAAGAEDGYLVSVGGAVYNEEGTLKTLGEFEYAFVSPDGSYYAVLTFEESSSFPLKSTARIYDKTGRLSYTVMNTGASRAVVADTGACVLVTMTRPEPTATAELAFYNASGHKTGYAEAEFPGDAAFSPGTEYAAIASAGDATYVFDTDGGDVLYELPASRTLAAGDDGLILLVDPEFIALYRDGFSEWEFDHDLYYPRMVELNHGNTTALVGCHHEVALLDLETGRIAYVWETPEGFAVTDIDASDDFSLIVVGARSLDGIEAVYLLDGTFETLKSEKKTIAKPSGATPVVTVIEGEHSEALAFGQGWRTTLTR